MEKIDPERDSIGIIKTFNSKRMKITEIESRIKPNAMLVDIEKIDENSYKKSLHFLFGELSRATTIGLRMEVYFFEESGEWFYVIGSSTESELEYRTDPKYLKEEEQKFEEFIKL
jgi:hypothetical protein